MNKILSTIIAVACLGLTYDAHGVESCSRSTTPPTGSGLGNGAADHCSKANTTWYFIYPSSGSVNSVSDSFASCSSCDSGYDRVAMTEADLSGTGYTKMVCSNISQMISGVYICKAKTCTDCTSDTNWVGVTTGYEKKTTATCNLGVCNKTTAYRCASGWYGNPGTTASGCTQCPQWSGVYTNSARTNLARGFTSGGGYTAISGCYIIPGTYYDVTGTFSMQNPCFAS